MKKRRITLIQSSLASQEKVCRVWSTIARILQMCRYIKTRASGGPFFNASARISLPLPYPYSSIFFDHWRGHVPLCSLATPLCLGPKTNASLGPWLRNAGVVERCGDKCQKFAILMDRLFWVFPMWFVSRINGDDMKEPCSPNWLKYRPTLYSEVYGYNDAGINAAHHADLLGRFSIQLFW